MPEKKTLPIRITDFSSGINSLDDPTMLGGDKPEFPILENVANSYGHRKKLVKRFGYNQYNTNQLDTTHAIQSIYEANFSSGAKLLGNSSNTSNSVLKAIIDPYTGSWGVPGATLHTGADVNSILQYTMLKDKVYIANLVGSANAVYDSTNYLDMGIAPCQTNLMAGTGAVVAGGGKTSSKLYVYIVTFLTSDEQESGSTGWTGVSTGVADTAVNLTSVPISANTRVTARKIYCSLALTSFNDLDFLYYVGIINDNTTTTYQDTTADINLFTPIPPNLLFQFKKPYISKYHTVHKNRLVPANLTENLYTPLLATDFTLTSSNGGGTLTGGRTYNFRFAKSYLVDITGGQLEYNTSNYISKSITIGGGDNAINIAYAGSLTDAWSKYWAICMTTNAGGTDFQVYAPFTNIQGSTDILAIPGVLGKTIVVNQPFQTNINLNSTVAWSDEFKPDLFSSVATEQIGQDDGDHITGIASEEDRIIVFKQKSIHYIDTRYTDSNNWYANKLLDGIGADDYSLIQFGNMYAFKSNRSVAGLGTFDVIYIWDGRTFPQAIGYKIVGYMSGKSTATFKNITYDSSNNWLRLIYFSATGNQTYEFIFDLTNGKWITANAGGADLKFLCYANTKSYGVLIGDGYGYVDFYDKSKNQDIINQAAPTSFIVKFQTPTYELYDRDIMPRRLAMDIYGGDTNSISIVPTVDNVAATAITLTGAASTFNRVKNKLFTGANDKSYRQIYFTVSETSANALIVFSFVTDFIEEHGEDFGR